MYQLAKEILLHPEYFDSIFLGLGGFHFEKVLLLVVASICKKLELILWLSRTKLTGKRMSIPLPVDIMFEKVCLVLSSILFEVTLRMQQLMEAMQIHSSR